MFRLSKYELLTILFVVVSLNHLAKIVLWTRQNQHPVTINGMFLKFFGIVLLMKRFQLSERRENLKTESDLKYMPASNF